MAGENCLHLKPVNTPTSVLCFIIFFLFFFLVFSSNGIGMVYVLAGKGIIMSEVKTLEKWCCAKSIA